MPSKLLLSLVALAPLVAAPAPEILFEKTVIDLGRSETCAVADINGDGKPDIISGERWYAAPDWTPHEFRKLGFANNYVDNFSDLPLDVDSDGDIDIISVAWFERRSAWFENPGHGQGQWEAHTIDQGSPVEFAFLVDLDNDGVRDELLPQYGGREGFTAWYEAEGEGESVSWRRTIVSQQLYGHGIGAGDVNQDGRNDILTPSGWLEAPADPHQSDWRFHADWQYDKLGFMYVLDVNGDDRHDILTSNAHDYGVFWLERQTDGKWKERLIDDAWSQAHALTLADLTGDGRPEIITGKRLYAHNGHDPGGREALGLYWYDLVDPDAGVWARHIIDYGGRVGGGMQIPVTDIDADGDPDIVVAGKGGVVFFRNDGNGR